MQHNAITLPRRRRARAEQARCKTYAGYGFHQPALRPKRPASCLRKHQQLEAKPGKPLPKPHHQLERHHRSKSLKIKIGSQQSAVGSRQSAVGSGKCRVLREESESSGQFKLYCECLPTANSQQPTFFPHSAPSTQHSALRKSALSTQHSAPSTEKISTQHFLSQ